MRALHTFNTCLRSNSIQSIYFPTVATILRERNALPANAAQVACEPIENKQSQRKRSSRILSASIPHIDECTSTAVTMVVPLHERLALTSPCALSDSGYAFSSPDEHAQRTDREIASLRVLQLNEKLRSFDRTSVASAHPASDHLPAV